MYACGIETPIVGKAISMREALSRLRFIVPEITEDELMTIDVLYEARNSELHSDKIALNNINIEALLPLLYCFISKILKKVDVDIKTIIGAESEHIVNHYRRLKPVASEYACKAD